MPNHKSGNKAKIEEFSKEFRIQPPVNINSIVIFKSNTPPSIGLKGPENEFDKAIGNLKIAKQKAPENEFDKAIGNLKYAKQQVPENEFDNAVGNLKCADTEACEDNVLKPEEVQKKIKNMIVL